MTARPSYARIKTVLLAIKSHPYLELQLVLAGSVLLDKYGSTVNVIEKDGFEVVEKIYNVLDGQSPTTMAKTTGIAIMELASTFSNLKPDVVVTIADRFETLATSIAASYQNIPLAHIQGGEVTGNIDEKVRHANTKLADIHFVASEDARKRVLKMGEEDYMIFNTGCPSIDIAREVLDCPAFDFDPLVKYGGVGDEINWKDGYLVVMQHPVTTEFEKSREHINATLDAINDLNIPTFWFWPNVDAGSDGTSKGLRVFREKHQNSNIHFFINMEPQDFLRLIKNSKCLVGNSSAGIRESSFLAVPAVNIGTRQNRRLRGKNVIDCSNKKEEIIESIQKHITNGHFESEFIYGNGYAGQKIANHLASCDLKFHKIITY